MRTKKKESGDVGNGNGHASANGNGHAFAIERGIPIPPKRKSATYPFADLDVGDSFFVAGRTPQTMVLPRMSAECELSRKFVTRTAQQSGVSGVRVWRLS